jgi:hypothetical protein
MARDEDTFAALHEKLYTKRMSALSSDTHPKMEKIQLDLIRRMPSWKKIAVVGDLNDTVRAFAVSGIKQRHPEASPEKVQRMLADLLLGEELARKVYGEIKP